VLTATSIDMELDTPSGVGGDVIRDIGRARQCCYDIIGRTLMRSGVSNFIPAIYLIGKLVTILASRRES
jgi:hypothetical protein